MGSKLIGYNVAEAILDALTSHICVVDPQGIIFVVNRAWQQFSVDNSDGQYVDYIGTNYLDVCQKSIGPASEEAPEFVKGLCAVLHGEQDFFQIEYACHSPSELRWFLAFVSPLRRKDQSEIGNMGAVISHMNITKRRLVEMAYARLAATDPLTGLPNRRFFADVAALDLDRFLRFGKSSSLLMIDLDHFKSINDTYGHAAGDEVLRSVASIGKSIFRSCDMFARLGGEEFVCLLPGTDEPGAVMVAEKLRSTIKRAQILVGDQKIGVTASIGVSSIEETDRRIDDALIRADKAMYQAKSHGRNCVRSYRPSASIEVH